MILNFVTMVTATFVYQYLREKYIFYFQREEGSLVWGVMAKDYEPEIDADLLPIHDDIDPEYEEYDDPLLSLLPDSHDADVVEAMKQLLIPDSEYSGIPGHFANAQYLERALATATCYRHGRQVIYIPKFREYRDDDDLNEMISRCALMADPSNFMGSLGLWAVGSASFYRWMLGVEEHQEVYVTVPPDSYALFQEEDSLEMCEGFAVTVQTSEFVSGIGGTNGASAFALSPGHFSEYHLLRGAREAWATCWADVGYDVEIFLTEEERYQIISDIERGGK